MWALNEAYDREETRGFLKRRLTGLAMVLLLVLSFALAFGLLVLGPHLSGWMGSAVGAEALVQWLWWTAQWPILLLGLLLAFATILYLGPDVDHPRWSFLTIGTVFAVVVWLAASGAFALFMSTLRLLRQDLGLPRDRDRHAHLALAQLPRAAPRSRSQRRSRTVPRTTPRRARRDHTHRTAEGITAQAADAQAASDTDPLGDTSLQGPPYHPSQLDGRARSEGFLGYSSRAVNVCASQRRIRTPYMGDTAR